MASKLKTIARGTGFALIAATPGFLPWPAAAQHATHDEKRVPPQCRDLGSTDAGVKCAIKELDRRIDAANAAVAAAKKKSAAADAARACIGFLVKGVNEKKWTQPEILAQAGGQLTPDNACEVARRQGFVPTAPSAAPRSPNNQ